MLLLVLLDDLEDALSSDTASFILFIELLLFVTLTIGFKLGPIVGSKVGFFVG